MTAPVRQKNPKREKNRKQVEEHAASTSVLKLLGEIITWNARTDVVHKHQDVTTALSNAGLDPSVARALLPRQAFTRAYKKLAEDQAIDVTTDTDTEVCFQFTKKLMRNNEWIYTKDTLVTLHKINGTIRCPKKELEQQAQKLLDAAIEERTTADITKIIQKLFEKQSELFSIRDQGGVYFVPHPQRAFVDKIDAFLKGLGGRVTRFPVPAGTADGDRAVQQSVSEAMQDMINEHLDVVDNFTINTRQDSIDNVAKKINATRVKIEAYAEYLKDQRDELLEAVERAKEILRQQVAKLAQDRQDAPPDSGSLYGYAVSRVLRWMGKEKWDFHQAKKALAAKQITVSDTTIHCQLFAGRKGQRGEPANLTKEQQTELTNLAK